MKFTLKKLKALIAEIVEEEIATGDEWLDDIYDRVVPDITGHTNPYYGLFYLIADYYKPDLVVELGSWRAYAAAHFAVGNPDGKVVTIDIHKDDQIAHAIANTVADRYDNLEFVHGWTWDDHVVGMFEPGSIDILFIDAWHEYQYVIREWELYEPLLADNALVIVDDVFDAEGATVDMVKFWNELEYSKFLNGDVHDGLPMGFLKYVRKVKK